MLHKIFGLTLFLALFYLLVGCSAPTSAPVVVIPLPTLAEVASLPLTATPLSPTIEPTWTPAGLNLAQATPLGAWATATAGPTGTAWFTRTPTPTFTPTFTPTPTNTPTPTPTPPQNLLPNPSFEGGWYHPGNVPELQIPQGWVLEWDEGPNPLDPDPWNKFVRPEVRVLPYQFLPPHEHALYVWDGLQTLKVFKREGALTFRLFTTIPLEAGIYKFEVNFFPDLIEKYGEGGQKVWASDPLSGEYRFWVNGYPTEWRTPRFGQWNTEHHIFEAKFSTNVRVGVEFRGRWAVLNNGWFMDDWSLLRLD